VLVAVFLVHRIWWRLLFGFLALLLVVANIGAAINAHYDYYPTFLDLFGSRGVDQASVRVLNSTKVPSLGWVVEIPIPGTVSHFDACPAQVYVPPAWFSRPRPRLPVIMLLHGTPGAPENWTVGGDAQITADQWARNHSGVAPLIVMPDINGGLLSDTECVDSPRGNAETYLTVDVPTRIVFRRCRRATSGPSPDSRREGCVP